MGARVKTRLRVGCFRAVGFDLNVARRADVELKAECAADLLDAVRAPDVFVENPPDGVLWHVATYPHST